VLVDDTPQDKPGTRVRDDGGGARARARERFASRGGEKLAGALDDLAIDVAGAPASTWAPRPAASPTACSSAARGRWWPVDVGYGQLDARLRSDPRVHVRDRTNARHLEPERCRAGLARDRGRVVHLAAPRAARARALRARRRWLLLVKPQFEVGPEQVGKGGVVRDDALARAGRPTAVAGSAVALGFAEVGRSESRSPARPGTARSSCCGGRALPNDAVR
jgi:23S rRNA (cytidine1920-2'-O)/16S rRNA (cytidine1409-2'-O)-methyltransferase